jgi:hypothetical protein
LIFHSFSAFRIGHIIPKRRLEALR